MAPDSMCAPVDVKISPCADNDSLGMAAMLVLISDWCLDHRIETGLLHDGPEPIFDDAIFPNGNFVRVLISTYELTGYQPYLDAAIGWCDHFAKVQANPIRTSRGNEAVWWWDYDQSNLYLADTGTAVHALFKAYPHVDDSRQKQYLGTLKKFYCLIVEGTECDPLKRGQAPSRGWVVLDGPDAGAFGVGYRKGQLENRPYTIATATAGAQFSSTLYKLTGDSQCRETALAAANWLLQEFEASGDGHIRYRIEGGVDSDHFYQGIHYSLEGLLSAWLYLDDESYRQRFRRLAPNILEFVLKHQNDSGIWGFERAYDGQRSAFLAHFLDWYRRTIEPDTRAIAAADRFVKYVLDPKNTARYGVLNTVNVTGFVGLVFASFLSSELDIRIMCEPVPLMAYSIQELRQYAERWQDAAGYSEESDMRSIE